MTRIICKCISSFFLLLSINGLAGCGSSGTSSSTGPTTLTVTGSAGTVLLGKTVQFTATGGSVTSWTVNRVAGGSATTGTITATGLYTAPAVLPAAVTVSVGAVAGSATGTANLTVESDVSVVIIPGSTTNPILTQTTLSMTANVTSAGAPSTAVTWAVNGVTNGNSTLGSIASGTNGSATYVAPTVQPTASVQITATSVADSSKVATLTRTVQGVLLNGMSGTPGQNLMLTGNFTAGTAVNVLFSDGGTFSTTVSVLPDSATQTTVILPTYYTAGSMGTQGTVSVAASQTSGSTAVDIGSSPGFTLLALPAATGNPGDVTAAFLQSLNTGVAQTKNMWDTLASASKGTLTVQTSDAAATDAKHQVHTLLSKVSTLSATPIEFGMQGTGAGATPALLTTANIGMMDRILQAYVLNNASVQKQLRVNLALVRMTPEQLSPQELLRAEAFSFLGLSVTQLGECVAIAGALALGSPAVATAGAAVFLYDIYVHLQKNTAATQASAGGGITDPYNPLVQLERQITQVLATDGITLTDASLALQNDSHTEITTMDDTSAQSEYMKLVANEPTINGNEPAPVTAPIANPTLTIQNTVGVQGGGTFIDVSFYDQSLTSYTVSASWGVTASVGTSLFGYGSTTLTVPAPVAGAACYAGTVSLLDTTGETLSSTDGCFAASTPTMDSVSGFVAAQSQTVVITGSGFGTHAPYSGSTGFISLADVTAQFGAGYGGDTVGLAVSLWSDTQIVLQGFTGAYGSGTDQYQLSTGDQLVLAIYNPISGDGPSMCSLVVGGGAAVCQ